MIDKKSLSEQDIRTQVITPANEHAGWDFATQAREEVSFTKGRIIVRGKLTSRGTQKHANYFPYAPSPETLSQRYCAWKHLDTTAETIGTQRYHEHGIPPNYYGTDCSLGR